MRCRIFPHESADGPANMALDEALLDTVAEDPSFALLRTYGWTVPTLSLGYFQPLAPAVADPRWQGVPVVRRPTGGGAIWHHHELTYALVVPAGHPLGRPATALYHAVHSALAALLGRHGVETVPRGAGPPSPSAPRPFLCFADRDPEDLICQGAKIVGSAQRRRSGAILQHGSMLLSRSSVTPEFPGVGDLSPACSDARYWSELVGAELCGTLGLVPALEELPLLVRQRGFRREREVYRNHAWNRRR
jgi:lipoyl(octanoyl) transferase